LSDSGRIGPKVDLILVRIALDLRSWIAAGRPAWASAAIISLSVADPRRVVVSFKLVHFDPHDIVGAGSTGRSQHAGSPGVTPGTRNPRGARGLSATAKHRKCLPIHLFAFDYSTGRRVDGKAHREVVGSNGANRLSR